MGGIGLRIKELRMQLKLSQEQFAKSINIKRANLGHIENESQLPTLQILSNISSKYNVPYSYLIDGYADKHHERSYQVNEDSPSYNSHHTCNHCSDKEKIIDIQRLTIDLLQEKNKLLESKINGQKQEK